MEFKDTITIIGWSVSTLTFMGVCIAGIVKHFKNKKMAKLTEDENLEVSISFIINHEGNYIEMRNTNFIGSCKLVANEQNIDKVIAEMQRYRELLKKFDK